MRERIIGGLLDQIESERKGEAIDRSLAATIVRRGDQFGARRARDGRGRGAGRDWDRSNTRIGCGFVAQQVRMLSTLQQYDAIFQTPFLDASRRYYQAVGIKYQAEVRSSAGNPGENDRTDPDRNMC